MKGIVLAGGSGTRLYPATLAVCKQLLPIFDKPMIYYPLSTLMQAGIREICLISTPEALPRLQRLFGDGTSLGISLTYQEQRAPRGIAEAFLLAEEFIGNSPVALVLGDNLFYGPHLEELLEEGTQLKQGALIFGYRVKDPERYGVVEFDASMQVVGIEEKPKNPRSSYAIPGLYFYGPEVVAMAKTLSPSLRGELEITDIHRLYLFRKELSVRLLEKGHAWLDAGTFDALQQASCFVQAVQERQGIKISCIEEIAYRKGYIGREGLSLLARKYPQNGYGDYLSNLLGLAHKPEC